MVHLGAALQLVQSQSIATANLTGRDQAGDFFFKTLLVCLGDLVIAVVARRNSTELISNGPAQLLHLIAQIDGSLMLESVAVRPGGLKRGNIKILIAQGG